ncbi:hypothetical protein TYRP_016925 [Tyrophagus putrescentiae]|nr:hypothetical protein TYRP_016925 [Tyrophagus putrescentiae]
MDTTPAPENLAGGSEGSSSTPAIMLPATCGEILEFLSNVPPNVGVSLIGTLESTSSVDVQGGSSLSSLNEQEARLYALGLRPREVEAIQTSVSHTPNNTITSSDTETGPNNSTVNAVVAVANELNSQKSPAENDVDNLSTKNVGNNAGQFSSSDVLQSVSTSANIADSGTRTEHSEMIETTTNTTTTTTKEANKTTITTTTTTTTNVNNNNNNNNNNNSNNNNNNNNNASTDTEQDNQPLLAPTEGPTGKVPVTMKEKRDSLRKNKQTEAVADLPKRQQAKKKAKKAKKGKKGKKAKKAATSSASPKGVDTLAKRRSARLRTVVAPLAELSAQSSVNKPKSKSSAKVCRPSVSTSPSTATTSASTRTRSQVPNSEAPPPPPPNFQLAAQVNETPSEMMVRRKKKQLYYCLWPGCAHWSDYQWNTGAHLRSVHLNLPKTKSAAEKKKGVRQLKALMSKWMRTDVPEKEKGKKN